MCMCFFVSEIDGRVDARARLGGFCYIYIAHAKCEKCSLLESSPKLVVNVYCELQINH